MPELPDISAYLSALEARIFGQTLAQVRLASVFLLRTVDPPLESASGHVVTGLRRVLAQVPSEPGSMRFRRIFV